MGTKNNVNPDHYKTAGRERPGKDIVQEIHKQKYTQAQTGASGSDFIPGTGEDQEEFKKQDTGQVKESSNASSNDN